MKKRVNSTEIKRLPHQEFSPNAAVEFQQETKIKRKKLKMKNQTNERLQTILLAAITTIFLLGAFVSTFAQGVGAKYGARDPRTCADKTLPKTGAPSAIKATEYVICSAESVNVYLYLVEDVKVQVSKGRPYNIREDINVPNIDLKVPVYPIRGSYKKYSCDQIRTDRSNLNRNCTIYTAPNAIGLCYKDTFGDWHCGMTDARTGDYTDRDVPPPGGATTATKDNKAAANNQPNNDAKQAENKTEGNANKDENGFPKPDLSAMEKWYEVVKYEYEPIRGRLYVYLKPKVEIRETQFFVEFKDKDGILLFDRERTQFSAPGKYDAQVGDTVKVEVYTPAEKLLKQAVSAKVFIRDHF